MTLPRRTCRGPRCHARIVMVPTETGANLPVDVTATVDGNVIIVTDLLGGPVAQVLGPDAAADARARGETLFTPHFATCPDADQF